MRLSRYNLGLALAVTTLNKNSEISSVPLLPICLHTLASTADWPMFWHGPRYTGVVGAGVEPLIEVTHDED